MRRDGRREERLERVRLGDENRRENETDERRDEKLEMMRLGNENWR